MWAARPMCGAARWTRSPSPVRELGAGPRAPRFEALGDVSPLPTTAPATMDHDKHGHGNDAIPTFLNPAAGRGDRVVRVRAARTQLISESQSLTEACSCTPF